MSITEPVDGPDRSNPPTAPDAQHQPGVPMASHPLVADLFVRRLTSWRDRLAAYAAQRPDSREITGELHMAESILYALFRFAESDDIDDITVCAFVRFESLQGKA